MMEILLKFGIVFVMSLIFGLERQYSNRPVGFGTFVFVAIGACTLAVIPSFLGPDFSIGIIGAVVTGVGFLGAGALIKSAEKVSGFTTAASIWIFSIIGLSIGFDQYSLGIIAYSITLIVVTIDRILDFHGAGTYQRKVILTMDGIIGKEQVLSLFGKNKWKLIDCKIDKKNKKSGVSYLVTMPRSYVGILTRKLIATPWVESFDIE
ncbi:MAG TPA: MgtC/SapB family protein [Candidatus Pacearchaeota archaeon]|nr:MgtC/SapB family protein [Candidatus Pacearchaeota archaeon]